MKATISITDVTERAVRAALAVIDEATNGTSEHRDSPCGDKLAVALDREIRAALTAHFDRDCGYRPAYVRATD